MPPRVDIVGHRFGRLRVISFAAIHGCSTWNCRCDCGNTTTVRLSGLQSGQTKSCGCLHREQVETMGRANRTHGDAIANTPEYRAWVGMKQRCHNPNDKSFADYGGRGIFVCLEWRESFEHFLADMGRKPSSEHSIDRVDNDGPYSAANCQWAISPEQNRNRNFRRKRTRRKASP